MEQFELFSTKMPDEETVVPAEKCAYFQEALPVLQKIAATRNVSPEQLDFFTRSQYSTVYFKSFLAFRIKMRGGKQYISFPATIKKSIKTDWPMEQTASEKTFYRIVLANSSLLPVMNVLEQILLATIDRYQAEWDCCSRYMECSDAKKCIHPDSAFSVACGYKRKLEAGKIFYGTNRNID